ncbi:MAG: hypothetical protein ACRCR3_03945 [Tannerellaceae bacterium]
MRNLLFISALLVLLLHVSCTQEETSEVGQTEIPVCFKVSTINVDTQPMSRSTTSGAQIGDVVNKIVYFIFDESNKQIKYGISSFTPGTDPVPEGFGTIETNLMPGKYNVLFYALGKGSGSCSFVNSDLFNSESYFAHNNKEVFYFTGQMTITTSSNNHSINLSRKSALLKINITDQVLPTVSKVVFSFSDSYRWYPKNSGMYKKEYSFNGNIKDNMVDIFEYYFSFPEALISNPVDVKVSIYDSNNLLIGEKIIPTPIYENRRTTISGDLFSTLGNQNIDITIDDIWGEDVSVPI